MIPLRNLLIAVLAISFFTFVALFGRLPALRKTPIGWLQRLLCIRVPATFRRLDGSLTGGRLSRSLSSLETYLLYQKNPVVLIIFLGLLTGSASLFLYSVYPDLTTRRTLPIPLLLGAPYLFTYLCVTTTSSQITPATHAPHLDAYPYDHILFRPKHPCRTCGLDKPARSKHCSLCGCCVAKADHHCPWVNNCLGRSNYRWFLLLLLSLGLVEFYGAYLAWTILKPNFAALDPSLAWLDPRYWDQWGKAFVRAINHGGISVAGVGLLAVTTAPLPLGLLAYHVYLVWAGMTTNESSKWADWRDDMADGVVYRAKRSVIVAKERERRRTDAAARSSVLPSGETDSDTEPSAVLNWPVKSDQMIVRTTDGKPPSGQEELWEQVTSLDHVVNIYDLGFWQNLVSIMQAR